VSRPLVVILNQERISIPKLLKEYIGQVLLEIGPPFLLLLAELEPSGEVRQ